MPSDTPPSTPPGAAPQPFARGRIQWGRPPQQVFRVGPLPRPDVGAPSQVQRRGTGAGILSGSMVPPRRAPDLQAPVVTTPVPEPVDTPLAEPVVADAPEPEPIRDASPEPAPEPAPHDGGEVVVEALPAEPVLTVPPLGRAQPLTKPRELPSIVVTRATFASMGTAIQKVTPKDRWIFAAGVAAIVVTGGFIWLATLPAETPARVSDTATPLVVPPTPDTGVGSEAGTTATARVAAPEARPRATAPARSAAATAPAPIQAPGPNARFQQRTPAEVSTPPAVATAPRPYIETAPLAVEPPTPAQDAPTDAEAPIPTQPQPLD